MPDQREFKIAFKIDLVPYAAGLETMMTMTAAAGTQLKSILTGASPDMGPLRAQLEQYDAALKKLGLDAEVTGGSLAGLVPPEVPAGIDAAGQASARAAKSTETHGVKINSLKRETMETVGALSFMTLTLLQASEHTGMMNSTTEKAAGALQEGITAGFGFASMLMLIPGVGQAAAVGLGLVTGAGAGLLKFFDDSEERAKKLNAALAGVAKSLKGATAEDLEAYRKTLSDTVVAQNKELQDLEEQRNKAAKKILSFHAMVSRATNPLGIAPEDAELVRLEAAIKDRTISRDISLSNLGIANQAIQDRALTAAEMKSDLADMEAQATRGTKYAQARAMAEREYVKMRETVEAQYFGKKIEANQKLEMLEQLHFDKLKQIRDEELREREVHILAINALEAETRKMNYDTDEAAAVAAAGTERERLRVHTEYALKRLAIDEETATKGLEAERDRMNQMREQNGELTPEAAERIKKINEEIAAIIAKFQAQQYGIVIGYELHLKETPAGSVNAQEQVIRDLTDKMNKAATDSERTAAAEQIKIEQEKLFQMTHSNEEFYAHVAELEEQRRQKFLAVNQTAAAAINASTTGVSSMFNYMFQTTRQAVDALDAFWLGFEQSALRAMDAVIEKQIEVALGNQMMAESAQAGSASPGGDSGLGIIGAGISFIGNIFGFADGGVLPAGQPGYFEGNRNEIIAPVDDFVTVATRDIVPRIMDSMTPTIPPGLAAAAAGNNPAGAADLKALKGTLERLIRVLNGIPDGIDLRADGTELKSAIDLSEEKLKSLKGL